MLRFLRTFFCRHDYSWSRNIYGDEIKEWGWKRSVWRCLKCGQLDARDVLHDDGDVTGAAWPLPDRGWD